MRSALKSARTSVGQKRETTFQQAHQADDGPVVLSTGVANRRAAPLDPLGLGQRSEGRCVRERDPKIVNCAACSYPISASQSLMCRKCRRHVCSPCMISGECPACSYDFHQNWEPYETTDAEIVQEGTTRKVKKGH